ncbi:hypothetical protein [Caenispirillum bisanense]|uniref:Uncharacterized protein n=1 Tax=Caenispirillum bisanense TaxID=414052 RepID=A0A286H1C8_9PROT|nr:hypothetical protein [Caenispirillum bisanense]SOE01522.1 hypothetical protein SAMN05421508_11916 [Caenispirillum bisanense]
MPTTIATTLVAADAWSRWLLATMDDHLAEAAFDGVPIDMLAVSSAYIAHGTQIAFHVGDVPPADLAEHLRRLADCVEEGLHRVPVLVDGRGDA